MPIKYKAIGKANPRDPQAPAKFYASATAGSSVTVRQIAKRIAQISTVSSVDTLAVLEAFLQIIPEYLSEGSNVKLGEFGSFSVRLKSEGMATIDALTAANIKGVKLHFRPGKEFQDVLNAVTFEKV